MCVFGMGLVIAIIGLALHFLARGIHSSVSCEGLRRDGSYTNRPSVVEAVHWLDGDCHCFSSGVTTHLSEDEQARCLRSIDETGWRPDRGGSSRQYLGSELGLLPLLPMVVVRVWIYRHLSRNCSGFRRTISRHFPLGFHSGVLSLDKNGQASSKAQVIHRGSHDGREAISD